MFRIEETLFHCRVEIPQQRIEKPGHIQQATGLFMQPQLEPGHSFEQFLQGSESTRQGHHRVSQFEHAGFALMHRVNHLESGEARMHNLVLHQCFRDHADHLTTQLQNGVSNHSHQSGLGRAVNQTDTT